MQLMLARVSGGFPFPFPWGARCPRGETAIRLLSSSIDLPSGERDQGQSSPLAHLSAVRGVPTTGIARRAGHGVGLGHEGILARSRSSRGRPCVPHGVRSHLESRGPLRCCSMLGGLVTAGAARGLSVTWMGCGFVPAKCQPGLRLFACAARWLFREGDGAAGGSAPVGRRSFPPRVAGVPLLACGCLSRAGRRAGSRVGVVVWGFWHSAGCGDILTSGDVRISSRNVGGSHGPQDHRGAEAA
jgi:hypothetical protein